MTATLTAARPEISARVLADARALYERDGFCIAPPLIPAELIARIPARMEAVMDGVFETGIVPMWNPKVNETKVRTIDQPHIADRTIYEMVSFPAIGRFAAAVTEAKMVQVWAVTLIYKPTGGDTFGGIGWHQDLQYWQNMWEDGSELLTAWVAISDVTEAAGPVRFVPGSQRWGLLHQGDFGNPEHTPVTAPEGKAWEEIPALLPPGAVSFHDCVTYHGSGPNVSAGPRLGFALHLRTERASPRPEAAQNDAYLKFLNDPSVCPTIYAAGS